MRWLLLSIIGILLGGMIHIVSLIMVPVLAPRDAYSRLVALGGEEEFVPVAASPPVVPFLDPTFEYRACLFDLGTGAVEINVPAGEDYLALSFHSRDGVAFFSLNNRAASAGEIKVHLDPTIVPEGAVLPGGADRIVVSSASQTGIVLLRGFVRTPSHRAHVRALLERATCRKA